MIKGSKHSQETIERMRKTQKGHLVSKETREKLSIQKLGDKNPTKRLEVRAKIKAKRALQVITPKMLEALKLGRGKESSLYKGGISYTKEYAPFMARKRQIMKQGNGGTHSLGDWANLKVQYNLTCPSCKKSEPEIKLTEDHIIPLSKGGSNNIENIQPLCGLCNSKKHTQIIRYEEFSIIS